MVNKYSRFEKRDLTTEEISAWLHQQPTLPKVFAQKLEASKPNPAEVGNANLTPPANTKNQRKISAKRKIISRQKFLEVAARQGLFCYWCGIPVVRESQLPKDIRIKRTPDEITYYEGNESTTDFTATIDHLTRVIDGGTDDLINLVISCSKCNGARDRITQRYFNPAPLKRNRCRTCGGKFIHTKENICSICGTSSTNLNKFTATIQVSFERLNKLIRRLFIYN